MFVVDTNVVSELMSDRPHPSVLAWIDAQPTDDLFVTAITEAEIRVGIAALPVGRRRRELDAAAALLLGGFFAGRVLPLDSDAAREYAAVVAERAAAGRPIGAFDGLIAAIVRSMGASVVTRDIGGFEGLGIEILNPWAVA